MRTLEKVRTGDRLAASVFVLEIRKITSYRLVQAFNVRNFLEEGVQRGLPIVLPLLLLLLLLLLLAVAVVRRLRALLWVAPVCLGHPVRLLPLRESAVQSRFQHVRESLLRIPRSCYASHPPSLPAAGPPCLVFPFTVTHPSSVKGIGKLALFPPLVLQLCLMHTLRPSFCLQTKTASRPALKHCSTTARQHAHAAVLS
jgi:hypothetical protein